jgi:hypothetical protein
MQINLDENDQSRIISYKFRIKMIKAAAAAVAYAIKFRFP